METRDRQWSDLSPLQQKVIAVAGAVEIVLTVVAAVDLRRRSAAEVRGPKALWALLLPVQPLGPVAYLVVGRR